MKTNIKKLLSIVKTYNVHVITTGVLVSLLATVAVYASGPERTTYTSAHPADHVVFNSITDNPEHGDERNFVLIREAGVGTYVNEIALQPGKEYEVYSYFHNNAKSSLNTGEGVGIAENVRMSAQLPSRVQPGEKGIVSTSITADNANPQKVWDEAYVTTTSTVALRYVAASAHIYSGGDVNNEVLSDSLFSSTGTYLGYFDLDGILPGCADYAGYVVYKIKVDQPAFTLAKQVANSGQNNWAESIQAQPGSTVDYKISYNNTGTTDQNNVTIKDSLPAGQTYIPGSTVLTNNANPNGLKVSDNVVGDGINIGNYGPGAFGTVTFSAKVNEELTCTQVNMQNTASAITGNGTISDNANVIVAKEGCVTALPTTGPVEIIAGFVGIAAITVGIVYYVKSRRDLEAALHTAQTQPTVGKVAIDKQLPKVDEQTDNK